MEDYYEILGVSRKASLDEIRSAWRRLAAKYHPDRNPGDKAAEEKFKKLSQAYQVLSDDAQRRQYDLFGGGASRSTTAETNDLERFFDAMGQIFGRSPFAPSTSDAGKGTSKKKKTAAKPCTKCKGEGMVGVDFGFFALKVVCPTCLGTGGALG